MAAEDLVNRVFREFNRYTGDGKPNAPAGAPLPVGDPQSGVHNPKKAELRQALIATLDGGAAAAQAVIDASLPTILAATDLVAQSAADAHADADRADAAAAASTDRAAEAAGYAAGLNIAPILPGDAGKLLQVNEDEEGSRWVDAFVEIIPGNGISVDNTDPAAPVIRTAIGIKFAEDFGAAVSAADNATNLNAAMVAIKAAGKQLNFASGTYNIKAQLLASSSLKLEGNGARTSIINVDAALGAGADGLRVSMAAGQSAHYTGLRFRDFGIVATSSSNADIGLRVNLASGAFLSNFEFDSINVGEFGSWGMMLDNSVDNTDGFFVGSVWRCSITNGFYAPNLGDSFNFELNQCHAGEGAGGGKPSIYLEGVSGARQYVVRGNNFTCRGGAVIAVNTDQLRLENNQCEHSWWTGDGAYTNPYGHDAHVVVKDSLQPTIVGNTMNSFPSFAKPITKTTARYDTGSPTITLMSASVVALINVGDKITTTDGLFSGTAVVLSKTTTSITIDKNAISTAVADVTVSRVINTSGASATLKIDGCVEALVENNDIALGRVSNIEITSTSKNTRIGANRYYGVLTPVIVDNGVGTIGVSKTPTLTGTWVAYDANSAPRYIKSLEGRVSLSGIIKSGTINTAAMTLPVGFRPSTIRYFQCASLNTATWVASVISIGADGVVTPIIGDTKFISLDSINFNAPLVS